MLLDVTVSLRRDAEDESVVVVEFVDSLRVGSWDAWMLRFVPSTVRVGFVLGEEITRPVGAPLYDEEERRK